MQPTTDRFLSDVARACCAAIALVCSVSIGNAAQSAYWRTTPPGAATPSAPGSGWTNTGGGNFTLTLPPGGSLYIAAENSSNDNEQKTVDLVINQVTGDPANPDSTRWLEPREAVGLRPPQANIAGHYAINSNCFTANPPFRHLCIVFEPCPSWEYIRFENISSQPRSFRLFPTFDSECAEKRRAASLGLPSDTLEIISGSFGVPGQMLNPQRITEIQIFPQFVEMDLASAAPITVTPGTGNWTPDPVFVDPFGNPRPLGGIRFWSDGFGMTPIDEYDCSITMQGIADAQYSVFAFDADAGEWQTFLFDLLELPWRESLDLYTDGDGVVNQGGWTAWDDDPAFDAPVSVTQARSAPNSAEIAGDADVVREFEGADSGFWTFECWQYIPSDFASGGGGQFAGTYFNLLSVSDGTAGSQWSVQMQFDSNDGLLKVFHGDGINTIDVPYETDRWVKIQTEVDLENDWTRVYYDDELVTEYEWTGGVIGDGAGALDIAAVDLFANGSSPVYYDDLVLVPVLTHCPADLAPPYGVLDLADINAFIGGFVGQDPIADMNDDGIFDLQDIGLFVDGFLAGCP